MPLHRVRLAGLQPQGCRFLRARQPHEPGPHAASPPSAAPAARTASCAADANLKALLDAGTPVVHAGRQELGLSRHRCARRHAGREPAP
ncbi:MAG: hypothetical protein M0C28_32595 [Candidatus Moduliflexus flocculans]|nr:hypothetical protein [Candidatus Moduliflexus flocculans]